MNVSIHLLLRGKKILFLINDNLFLLCLILIFKNLYFNRRVILGSRFVQSLVHLSWLTRFVDSNLKNLNEFPLIIFVPLTNKKLRAIKSSPKLLEEHTSDDYSEDDEDSVLAATN